MHNTEIYNPTDTICAISTPPGVGGIAVVRVSGSNAIEIVSGLWTGSDLQKAKSHTAHFGKLKYGNGEILDEALVTVFRNPKSFTGEDVVEISVHGSRWIQSQLIQILLQAGCRMALPGEFTQRAFKSGKMDLAQAEGVADLIASNSKASHSLAISQLRGDYSGKIEEMRRQLVHLASLLELELDFSEEDVEFASRPQLIDISENLSRQLQKAADSFRQGNAIKDGIPIALIGKTNAGKSSLMNVLVEEDRAIVSDIHGTTRDIIEESIALGDYRVRFQDTAGIRETVDPIENLGIERSLDAAMNAEIILYVVDISAGISPEDINADISNYISSNIIIVLNKCDLTENVDVEKWCKVFPLASVLLCSAITGDGIDALRESIKHRLNARASDYDIIVANARHAEAFTQAAHSLRSFSQSLTNQIPTDLAAQDLRQTIYHLSSITGAITTPEILSSIFANFCIGK